MTPANSRHSGVTATTTLTTLVARGHSPRTSTMPSANTPSSTATRRGVPLPSSDLDCVAALGQRQHGFDRDGEDSFGGDDVDVDLDGRPVRQRVDIGVEHDRHRQGRRGARLGIARFRRTDPSDPARTRLAGRELDVDVAADREEISILDGQVDARRSAREP